MELLTFADDCRALFIKPWKKQESNFVVEWTIVMLLLEKKCTELLENVIKEEVNELIRSFYLNSKRYRHGLQVLVVRSQRAQAVVLPEEVEVVVDAPK
jgi:hypothetical protein